MNTAPAAEIIRVETIDARVEPFEWRFPIDCAEEIEAEWARETALKPELYNGEVLIQHRGVIEDGIYRAGYSFTRYKPFLIWHRRGHPGPKVRNGFAMAALRTRDDAYLLGVMGAHTANAGKIYFAAGTPDRDDVLPDGRVDLAGSAIRELEEETGLREPELSIGEGWVAVVSDIRVAFMRPVLIDLPAEEARRLMLARMKSLVDEELSDIYIVRGPQDIDPARMPAFQIAYLNWAFRR
jgi:8-oxo-dGTP pyrophosphatase MutT (NUDIX family)